MNLMQILPLMIEVATKEKRHPNYKETVRYARLCKQLYTGEDLEDLIDSIERRESEEERKERLKITEHVVKTVSQNIASVFYKVPRSNGKNRVLMYGENADEKRVKKLNDILWAFNGNQSFDDWIGTRLIELNFIDPNAHVVLEWKDFDAEAERAQPYPFEVPSENVLWTDVDNNILKGLCVLGEWDATYTNDRGERVKSIQPTYTWYGENQTIKMLKVSTEDNSESLAYPLKAWLEDYADGTSPEGIHLLKEGEFVFALEVYTPHDLNAVPAFCVGYTTDPIKPEIKRSPIDASFPLLKKTIKVNSELDITMYKHAFPQKIQYRKRCSEPGCKDGRIIDTNATCQACGGTGFEVHSSAMDVITVAMPKDPEQIFDLDQLIAYKYPPIEGIKFMDEYLQAKIAEAKEAVFGTDIFTRKQIADTATGKRIDEERVYDKLFPCSLHISKVWEYGIETIAKVTELIEGLIFRMSFSKDFRLKAKTDYIEDYKVAKEAGLGYEILRNIEDSIAQIDYADDQEAYLRYQTRQHFDPFRGKSQEEAVMAAMDPSINPFYRTLWVNEDAIYMELEMEYPAFYRFPRKRQWELIKEKTEAFLAAVKPVEPSFEA